MQQLHVCNVVNQICWSIFHLVGEILVYLCTPNNWDHLLFIKFFFYKHFTALPNPRARMLRVNKQTCLAVSTLCMLCSSTMSVTHRSLGATVLFCSRCVRWMDMPSPSRSPTVPPLLTVRYSLELCRYSTWSDQRSLQHHSIPLTLESKVTLKTAVCCLQLSNVKIINKIDA